VTAALAELRRGISLDRHEAAGAVADLGVLVPIAAVLIVSNGLSPTAALLPAGLLYLVASVVYALPVPVQPLKAFGAIAIAFLVHPLARRQEAIPLAITRGLYLHTSPAVPVITNTNATLKYLSPSYGPRKLILRQETSTDSAAAFVRRFGRVSIALLDRNDSEMFRQESAENARFLLAVQSRCEVRAGYDERLSQWAHLRIFELRRCQ